MGRFRSLFLTRKGILLGCGSVFAVFCAWRMVRPFNNFSIMPHFSWPIEVDIPDGLTSRSAKECGACHTEIYAEWSQSMHGKSSQDPYFRSDWGYDAGQAICFHCHAPVKQQQKELITGYSDIGKLYPIVEPNPEFDPELLKEGVTCVACHVREGKIVGPFEPENAPHPVEVFPGLGNSTELCDRCHQSLIYPGLNFGDGEGQHWGTPIAACGTVEEIEQIGSEFPTGCPACHMPPVTRPVVEGGKPREGRRHLFVGSHNPDTVRQAVDVQYRRENVGGNVRYTFSLENVGTTHYLPTGIPDRKLTLELRLLDADRNLIKRADHYVQRKVIWKPFILVLEEGRLINGVPRTFTFEFDAKGDPRPAYLDVRVSYHLVGERRRKSIGYANTEPISYPIYRRRLIASSGEPDAGFTEGEKAICSGIVPIPDRVPPPGSSVVPGQWKHDTYPEGSAPNCENGGEPGIGWPFW